MSDQNNGLPELFNIIMVLAVDHWIVSSLILGLIMYFGGSVINENAQTNAGAITSGVIAICGQVIFGFGVFAAIIALVKFIWVNA